MSRHAHDSNRAVVHRARRLHERDCPNDLPYEQLSEQHKNVHETQALRDVLAEKGA